ncbi:stage II sporulation protein M [soil metagenome]
MDIDRYMQRNDPTWRRLGELSRRGGRSVRGLSDDEITELVALYQRVSAQLSHARTQYRDPDLNARLSQLLGEARNVIYRRRGNPGRVLVRFLTETFPAAVWYSRRFVLVAFLCFFVPAVGFGVWLVNSPSALDAAVPPELQRVIAEDEFESYYSSDAAQNFAGEVTVNNIQVAFLAFALGVVPVLGPVWILANNGMNVGAMAAVMHRAGEGPQFWGLILPHGLLEISAILVAGAAGLRLSWALIAPGDRTRAHAFREEGMRAVVIVMGLVMCFIVAGFIEGFVTPSGLPTALRVGVGVAVLAAFSSYIVLLGSRAERKGLTGLLGEQTRNELALAEARATLGTVITVR